MSDDFDADFNAGFDTEEADATPTKPPEANADDDTQAAAPVVAAVAEPVVAEPVAVAPKPKYAKVTEEQLASIVAQAADSQRKFDQAFGKIGGLQQMIDALKSSTVAGEQVAISAEDFAELKAEYPELTELTVKGMNKALGKMKGTGAAVGPAQLEQLVQQRLAAETPKITQAIEQSVELRLLKRSHGDWKEVVASPEYNTWLAKQPETVRTAATTSWDSDITIPIISSFKESRKADKAQTTQAVSTRQQRLEAGINPRGTGGHAPGPTEDDDFHAGFNSG